MICLLKETNMHLEITLDQAFYLILPPFPQFLGVWKVPLRGL